MSTGYLTYSPSDTPHRGLDGFLGVLTLTDHLAGRVQGLCAEPANDRVEPHQINSRYY